MQLGFIAGKEFSNHTPLPICDLGHPERPERNDELLAFLQESGLLSCGAQIPLRRVTFKELCLVHSPDHVTKVRDAFAAGKTYVDAPNTTLSRESFSVATLTTGSILNAIDQLLMKRIQGAVCLVRPPGHHASATNSMGFCLFNNAAVAARYAQLRHRIERIMIIDWDAHHGNGTQEIFESDSSVYFFSIHGDPRKQYPYTGFSSEKGIGKGLGTTKNIPLDLYSRDTEYLATLHDELLPEIKRFLPQLIILSAGFDPHERDPIGKQRVSTNGFRRLTRMLLTATAGVPICSVLEGGYDIRGLTEGCAVHIEEMLSF